MTLIIISFFNYQVALRGQIEKGYYIQWRTTDNTLISAYGVLRTKSFIPADTHNNFEQGAFLTFSGVIVYPMEHVEKRNFVVDVDKLFNLNPIKDVKLSKVYRVMDMFLKNEDKENMTPSSPSLDPASEAAEAEESFPQPVEEAILEAIADDEAVHERVLEESFMLSSDSSSSGFERLMAEHDV